MISIKDTHPEVVQLFRSANVLRELAKCIVTTNKMTRFDDAEQVLENCMDLEQKGWDLLKNDPPENVVMKDNNWSYIHHEKSIAMLV